MFGLGNWKLWFCLIYIYIPTTFFRFRVAWMEGWIWCTFKILAAIHMRKFETFWNAGRNFETRLCSPPNRPKHVVRKHEKEINFRWWKSQSGECRTAFGSPSCAQLVLVIGCLGTQIHLWFWKPHGFRDVSMSRLNPPFQGVSNDIIQHAMIIKK